MDRDYGLPVDGAHLELAWANIAGLHRKPFDAQLLLQQIPPPYSVASLLAAAQALSFDTRFFQNKPDRINLAWLRRRVDVIAHHAKGKRTPAKSRDTVNEKIIEERPVGGNEHTFRRA